MADRWMGGLRTSLSLLVGVCVLCAAVGANAQDFSAAVGLALIKDPRINAVIAGAQAEEARTAQIAASGRPQISGSVDYQDGLSDTPATQIALVELSQELYSFGRLATSLDAAYASADLAWIEVGRTNQDVFADTSIAYANVLEADALLAIRDTFRADMRDRLDAIEARIDAGLSGITEFQSLARRVAEAEVAYLMAEQETIITRLELERLTGDYFGQVHVGDLQAYLGFVPTNLADTLFLAENNSPESHVSQQRFRIVEAEIIARSRENVPSLEAYSSYEYGERAGADVRDSQIGIRLSVPIFQGGLRTAVAQEGAQSRQEALRLRQQDQLLIRQSAQVAWTNLEIAYRALGVWQRSVQLQQQRVEAVQNELDADLASVDDLIDARADLVDTRAEAVRARYDIIRAQLVLLRTVGLSSPAAGI